MDGDPRPAGSQRSMLVFLSRDVILSSSRSISSRIQMLIHQFPFHLSHQTENANDALKGRILEASLADLNKDDEQSFRKFRLRIDEVSGRTCLTNFYGMDFTSDKIRSLVRKWQSLIEAHQDVKTTDGYLLRVFVIGFTKRRSNQVSKTTYAKSSQIRAIRQKMFEIVNRESTSCDLKELVAKLIPEVMGREIEKACQGIYPLKDVYVRKVKVLKR